MNKAELVDAISKKTKLSKANTDKVLTTFMDVVKNQAKKGDKITLVGFGTYEVRQRKATTGVNPKTREKIKIPAKKVLKFKTSDVVNDMLNKKK